MKQLKTANDFLEFFEAIPARKWKTCGGVGHAGERCAVGLLTRESASAAMALHDVTQRYAALHGLRTYDFYAINDSNGKYKELGDTPKERVINALTLVAAGLWKQASREN